MNNPLISIIIPTHNSAGHLKILLDSVRKQKSDKVEIIVVDNKSSDNTLNLTLAYNASIIKCEGLPPQVAKQRNLGAKSARGVYLYFMDHDMELSSGFISHFSKKISNPKFSEIDAWYIPEKIISNSKLLVTARNFEAEFINNTVVSAARLIKKTTFDKSDGFDPRLSSGPADWDFDLQLRKVNSKFDVFDKNVYHHEENLNIRSYIFKKTNYISGEEIYKKKWKTQKRFYDDVVRRQYSLKYRIFWVFIENGKWKKLLRHLDQYIIFLAIKLSLAFFYEYWKRK